MTENNSDPIKSVAVLGGDMRFGYLANLFAKDGFETYAAALDDCPVLDESVQKTGVSEAVENAGLVILPLPSGKNSPLLAAPLAASPLPLAEVFTSARAGQIILGGQLGEKLIAAASLRKILLVDYLKREEMCILNAIPTCEGALEIALGKTEHTLFGSRCLVAGYGRLGRLLASMLRDLGARVAVFARRLPDFAWIKANRLQPLDKAGLEEKIGKMDII
ncbi:MAG: hypothetical protein LBQ48_02660, partial [Oscillospiraceae bacterium]|nr:hypothetical protein [Oscillospiraceae bacterium]